MVGKFLLGMVSGGLVVTGGLVVGSLLFPPHPANDNSAAPATEETIAAPKPAKADAGKPAEPADTAPAPADQAATDAAAAEVPKDQPAEPAPAETATAPAPAEPAPADAAKPEPASAADTAKVEPAAEPAKAADSASTTEPASAEPKVAAAATDADAKVAAPEENKPQVADALPAPEAPAADTELAQSGVEAGAPAAAAVAAPETASEPSKPAPAEADAAATPPEPAPAPKAEPAPAPAATPETKLAEAAPAEPAPATAEASPPVTEPAPEAPAQNAPAAPAPAAEPAPAEAPAAPEVAPAPEPTPAPEPAPEVKVAEAAPGADAVKMPGKKASEMPGMKAAGLPKVGETGEEQQADGTASTFKPAPGQRRTGEGSIIDRNRETTDPAPAAEAAATPADTRPIAQFAAPFENPDNKAPFAIVLIDDGRAELDRAALAALPLPVSIALDPLDPAAPDRAAAYRAAGKEVVMEVTGIAEGAQASDVEVAFQSMAEGLPEAVAAMDLPKPAFQNNRPLASTVVPILKAQGRGLLTWDEGLNAADQVARREDLEAAVVFRNLDQAKGDKTGIRRLLDRAVFKAGQEGRVAVVATADPETLAALLEWSVEGKAATVALAPLTAVLKVD